MRSRGEIISIDRSIEANHLSMMAKAIAGFGPLRPDSTWAPGMFAITGSSPMEAPRRADLAARNQARTAKAEVSAAMHEDARPPVAGMTPAGTPENPRGDAGQMAPGEMDFDIKALVRTTIQLFQGSAASKSTTFDVHGVEGVPQPVRGDSARLQHLLSNLLSNAIRATQDGKISITLTPSRWTADVDFWMLIVKDEGRGMEGEAIGRLLSQGDRIDALRDRLQDAAGLELAISQKIAEAMGGTIAASSDPARGTTLSIELPFKRGGRAAPQQAETAAAAPMRILLAEDNPINRRRMSALLTRRGHDVVAVEDGRRALGAITNEHFDLIIMDMQMPELDGIAATRAIRALDPPPSETPILAISADTQPERQRVYFEAGISNFLPKPLVQGQLLDMVARMRRDRPEPAEQIGNRFDRERLNQLVEHAGYDDAALFIKMLLSDVADRPIRIAAAVRAEAWELAAIEADALRTLLDNFGRFGLARLLTAVARQCRGGECPPAVIAELAEQARILLILLRDEVGGQS